ncbi:MAG: tetratricopeptide repeat protein [Candidatus Amoebophilus sp.]
MSQYHLAQMWEEGPAKTRHNKDQDQAIHWYRKAAAGKNKDAQYKLGVAYLYGQGVGKDVKRAANWFIQAAENGHVEAAYLLAELYEQALPGIRKDIAKAFVWYQVASEKGCAKAFNKLGDFYVRGIPGLVQQDYTEAWKAYVQAAEQGYPTAQRNIGFLYENGLGVQQDYQQAFNWYQASAVVGQEGALGKAHMARHYYHGLGLAEQEKLQHVQAAKQLLQPVVSDIKKAAQANVVEAQYLLGWMYEHGQGVIKNPKEAFKWYKEAGLAFHVVAQYALGDLYYHGQGIGQDAQQAAEWYIKAANQGYTPSMDKLHQLASQGTAAAQNWVKSLASQQKALAILADLPSQEQGHTQGQAATDSQDCLRSNEVIGIIPSCEQVVAGEVVISKEEALKQDNKVLQESLALLKEEQTKIPVQAHEIAKRSAAEQQAIHKVDEILIRYDQKYSKKEAKVNSKLAASKQKALRIFSKAARMAKKLKMLF